MYCFILDEYDVPSSSRPAKIKSEKLSTVGRGSPLRTKPTQIDTRYYVVLDELILYFKTVNIGCQKIGGIATRSDVY